jgi:hypothetical protein
MHITFKDAHQAVKDAVEAKGADYVYSNPGSDRCLYVHGDTPGCIVGHALYNLGASIDLLRVMDNADESIIDAVYDLELVPAGVTMTDKALKFLAEAQMAQDTSAPWGRALETAEAMTEHDAE